MVDEKKPRLLFSPVCRHVLAQPGSDVSMARVDSRTPKTLAMLRQDNYVMSRSLTFGSSSSGT